MGGEGNEYARGGRQIHTNKPEVQAKEKWVYVKRAVKGRIRMELRIREVDKSGRRRRVAGPFDKLRDRGSFITVGELVELAVISCARSKGTARHSPRKRGIHKYWQQSRRRIRPGGFTSAAQ